MVYIMNNLDQYLVMIVLEKLNVRYHEHLLFLVLEMLDYADDDDDDMYVVE